MSENKKKTQKTKSEFELIKRIVEVLKYQPGGLWIREIARQTNTHPEIIRRIINKNTKIFEEYADLTRYRINLKFIRLRKDYKQEYLKILKKEIEKKEIS